MPPKLTVSDYTFYFVRNDEGRYRYKNEQGHIFRKQHTEFSAMIHNIPEHNRRLIIELFGITNVQIIKTGEHTLVYDLFADLRDEEIK